MARTGKSQSLTISACTGGLNKRDNVDQMDPLDAIVLTNCVPRNSFVENRNGYTEHATGLGTTVKTLHEHDEEGQSKKLLAFANGKIWDATAAGAAVQLATGFTEDEWSTTMLDGISVFVNGADDPQKYTVGGGVSTTVFTGIADPKKLIHINTYAGRLWGVEKDTASLWYGGDGAIAGPLTEFPVGKILRKGGTVVFSASWTYPTAGGGGGADKYLIIASSNGELLIYSGDYPGASDWTFVGNFDTARVINRRSYFRNGPDLIIVTENGIIPLPQIMSVGSSSIYANLSDKISNLANDYGARYGSLSGWCAVLFDKGQLGIVNVPTSASTFEQLVFNPLNRNWCRFTGLNGYHWVVCDGGIYFGGLDGKVYKADNGLNDNGNAIPISIQWAYNYFGNRESFKHVKEVSPIMSVTGSLSLTLTVRADYRDLLTLPNPINIVTDSGVAWDDAAWDTFFWANEDEYFDKPFGVSAYGKAISVGLEGNIKDVRVRISALRLLLTLGAIR